MTSTPRPRRPWYKGATAAPRGWTKLRQHLFLVLCSLALRVRAFLIQGVWARHFRIGGFSFSAAFPFLAVFGFPSVCVPCFVVGPFPLMRVQGLLVMGVRMYGFVLTKIQMVVTTCRQFLPLFHGLPDTKYVWAPSLCCPSSAPASRAALSFARAHAAQHPNSCGHHRGTSVSSGCFSFTTETWAVEASFWFLTISVDHV